MNSQPAVALRHGRPAHDQADIVYVAVERVRVTAQREARWSIVPQARFVIDLLRPWPSDATLDAEHAAAADLIVDAATLWYGIVTRLQAGTLFVTLPPITCEHVIIGDLVPIESTGGLAGWRFTLDIDI